MWRKLDSSTPVRSVAHPWVMPDAADKEFRATLQALDCWSAQADQLFNLMARTGPAAITNQDKQLLPQVAQAALAHTDIGAAYPKFFRQLLGNPLLRQAFLQQITQLQSNLKAL